MSRLVRWPVSSHEGARLSGPATKIYFGFPSHVQDIVDNSATSTQSILSAEAQAANNSGSGSFTTADATAETLSNSAQSTQSLGEEIVTPPEFVASLFHQTPVQIVADPFTRSTTLYFAFPELVQAVEDTLTNSAESTQVVLSAEAQAANNAGTGTFITADATAETVSTSKASSQIILEAITVTDIVSNSASSINTLTVEAISEINDSTATSELSISDIVTILIVEDIYAPGPEMQYEFVAA